MPVALALFARLSSLFARFRERHMESYDACMSAPIDSKYSPTALKKSIGWPARVRAPESDGWDEALWSFLELDVLQEYKYTMNAA